MKKKVFAICDLEASYACNLSEYLNGKKAMPFEVQAFTNAESLQKFALENEIGILLISPSAFCREVRELPIDRVILLSEGEQREEQDLPFVYKYQSSDAILAEVMEYYVQDHPQQQLFTLSVRKTRLYGVYSPISRARKTSFALALGEILAESGKVLYLNFEEFSGFEALFQEHHSTDMTDLIYFYRQKDSSFIYKLNSVIQTFHNLEYIPPAISPMDLRDVSAQEWIGLLNELLSFREYDAILLDLSWQVNELFQILSACDRIYMAVMDDLISQAKLKQYERLTELFHMEELQKKTIRIRPPIQQLQRDGSDPVQQLVYGEMGSYVRHLLRREENPDG